MEAQPARPNKGRRVAIGCGVVAGVLLLLAFILALFSGLERTSPGPSASAPPSAQPPATIEPTPAVPTELDKFREDCARGVQLEWRPGLVRHTFSIEAEVGKASYYEAIVDISEVGLPNDRKVVVADGMATREIAVKCRLAAKLEASSEMLQLEPKGDEWIERDLSSPNAAQWSWFVTPTEPVDQTLKLTIRPALNISDGGQTGTEPLHGSGGHTEVSYSTPVSVNGTWIEELNFWFTTQWPLLIAIGGAVAFAFGAVALKIPAVIHHFRELRPSSDDGDQDQSQPAKTAAGKQTQRQAKARPAQKSTNRSRSKKRR